jgi:4-diphosphocytidyl-2-C-methyl-D-erythritol kinase
VILFPNCKINLGLNILHKRNDGFHDIDTIFYPLPLFDVLECLPNDSLQFSMSGIQIEGNVNDNLILKAYHLLKKDYPQLPFLNIHLLKNIPTGAGLGGGSADASFMMMMLNKMFDLQISKTQLLNYALMLGSDCPFFVYNVPCEANSRGEILKPINLLLNEYKFLLVKPAIHVNTGWAFSQINPNVPKKSCTTIIEQKISTWQNELVNDFEIPLFSLHPELKTIKQTLIKLGAIYASMSGSGSTIFGIFHEKIDIAKEFASHDIFWV